MLVDSSNLKAKGRSQWLSEHLDSFVKPYLGFVPEVPKGKKPYFSREEMSVIKNIWRSFKSQAKGRPIILPGRDVFIFEILARREGYPTAFIPECSRLTVSKIKLPETYKDCLVADTGFIGTIPEGLKAREFSLVSHVIRDSRNQVFPKLSLSRSLALKIEYTPKYWRRGYIYPNPWGTLLTGISSENPDLNLFEVNTQEPKVKQEFSDKREFEQAAILTIEIYKDSSPKFIPGKKPLKQVDYSRTWSIHEIKLSLK